jgi:hypothetical protein
MTSESSALVRSGFRTPRKLHVAEWTAQLVVGVRAIRRLAELASAESLSNGASISCGGGAERRALPGYDSDESGRSAEYR